MLQLRTAVAAGRRHDRATASDLLIRAEDAAERLGEDSNYWTTGFGPTNVQLHRLSVALDLGDVAYVVEHGPAVPVDHVPAERRVSHLIDLARALSLAARDDEALTNLLSADDEAPQLVRHNPGVRETVRTMHRRAPVSAGRSSALLALAERCRGRGVSRPGPFVGLVCSAVGGVEEIRTGFVMPAIMRGWRVGVTLTPIAAQWLQKNGELPRLEEITGLPVRYQPRSPQEESPHPSADCWAAAPVSANTVAKLALGIADNQALTQLCEAIGGRDTPVVIFPRVNAAHAGQPAWPAHLDALRGAGVRLVYGEDVWPLHRPRSAPPGRPLPWKAILDTVDAAFLVAFDGTGAEVITVTVAGNPPKVAVGQDVLAVELEAIPWVQEKRSGTAYRAKDVRPAQPVQKAA